MTRDLRRVGDLDLESREPTDARPVPRRGWPGKLSRTLRLPPRDGERAELASAPATSASLATPLAADGSAGAAPHDDPFALHLLGAPQPVPHRAQMEQLFGQDFSTVQSHVAAADALARTGTGAVAAARGETVLFSAPSPTPEQVAHELTHVVQQRQAGSRALAADRGVSQPGDPAEVEAEQVAAHVAAHGVRATPVTVRVAPTAAVHFDRASGIRVPRPDAPRVRDSDGETLVEYDRAERPGKIRLKPSQHNWKTLAATAAVVELEDSAGDWIRLQTTYRLESRPAEREGQDVWIATERYARIRLASGEMATARLDGQARVLIGIDEPLDPRAAIARQSLGPNHTGEIHLIDADQSVFVFGHGKARSLVEDAAGDDLLAYDEPLRMLMAVKRSLKQHGVAGKGPAVARKHADVGKLLAQVEPLLAGLERHIEAILSYHDGEPALIAQAELLASRMADEIAQLRNAGRGDHWQVEKLERAHLQLLRRVEEARAARPPQRSLAADVLGVPLRFLERTGKGLGEVGLMAVDTVALGTAALGKATGAWDLDWDPVSDYGQHVDATGASSLDGLTGIVTGFIDGWEDALERAGNGDYTGVMDMGLDTALMLDGARTTAAKVKVAVPEVIARARSLAGRARGLARRLPAEAREVALAMAEASDTFARTAAAGMQMAGGPRGAGGPGPTVESVAAGLEAARNVFRERRLSQVRDRSIDTLKRRLGKDAARAPDVATWVDRVERALGGDANATVRFLKDVEQRLTTPAAFMREVEALLGSTHVSADDLAKLLGGALKAHIVDPVAFLADARWLAGRGLTPESRSMLLSRAAAGGLDLDWLRKTGLTNADLDLMGADSYTAWQKFEAASELTSARRPAPLADREPDGRTLREVHAKIRGIAGEQVAAEMELPQGLKLKRRVISNNRESSPDYELVDADGNVVELEVKAGRSKHWPRALDEYEATKEGPVARLVDQVKAGHARGRKVYVAVSDGLSRRSRDRLAGIFEALEVPPDRIIYMPESEILRVGAELRQRMGIKPPVPPGVGDGE